MRVLVFGTYDTAMHPRVATLAEGLRAAGLDVTECNAPLDLPTADRVAILAKPSRLPKLLLRIATRWAKLAQKTRRLPKPDVVLVGYLGHFDVHLARLLFPRTPIVLDHLIGASDTARDRKLDGGFRATLMRWIDTAALNKATIIVVDTDEHLDALPRHRDRAIVVPVGAPHAWFAPPTPPKDGPLKVVFFGLYTPLQGAPTIGAALAKLNTTDKIDVTMIGHGQDEAATKEAATKTAAKNTTTTWLDWVPSADLPALVASHDVCLGIFGTGPKALRVVPNKVFQGAAAGCAIVTSDTPPQRQALGDAALFVPPGDPDALADALKKLAADRAALDKLRSAARQRAADHFAPEHVVAPLVTRMTRMTRMT